jgi:molecular chaperone DnaJ
MGRSLQSIVTHYERLGVKPSASLDEMRRAYRNLARAHHPDATGTGSAVDMAAVNEAWRVLSDPARRAVYDASLRSRRVAARPVMPQGAGDTDLDDATGFVPIRHPLARLGIPLPWIVVLGVLALIFVFTAYAVRSAHSDGGKPDGVIQVGSCVTVVPDGVTETACDSAHDGRVMALPPSGTLCDPSLSGVLDRRTGNVVCVRRG